MTIKWTTNEDEVVVGIDDRENWYKIDKNQKTVIVKTPDGFTGCSWTAKEALAAAMSDKEVARKSYLATPPAAETITLMAPDTAPIATEHVMKTDRGHVVKAVTQTGFVGQGYSAAEAISAARWNEAQAAKSYVTQPIAEIMAGMTEDEKEYWAARAKKIEADEDCTIAQNKIRTSEITDWPGIGRGPITEQEFDALFEE